MFEFKRMQLVNDWKWFWLVSEPYWHVAVFQAYTQTIWTVGAYLIHCTKQFLMDQMGLFCVCVYPRDCLCVCISIWPSVMYILWQPCWDSLCLKRRLQFDKEKRTSSCRLLLGTLGGCTICEAALCCPSPVYELQLR